MIVIEVPKLTEAQITKQCCDYARSKGFRAIRLHSGLLKGQNNSFVRLNKNGTPDYLFLAPLLTPYKTGTAGVFFCEFKAEGKALTREQVRGILARPTKSKDAKARTRMADQLAAQEELISAGYLVLTCDSLQSFKDLFEVYF